MDSQNSTNKIITVSGPDVSANNGTSKHNYTYDIIEPVNSKFQSFTTKNGSKHIETLEYAPIIEKPLKYAIITILKLIDNIGIKSNRVRPGILIRSNLIVVCSKII